MRILGKAISGTAGARTHVQRAGGSVCYQRPCPVNRNTLAQSKRRGIFASAAQAWKKLFALNQEKCAELARAEKRTDALGHPTRVLPFNYFCRARMRGEQIPPTNEGVNVFFNAGFYGFSTFNKRLTYKFSTELSDADFAIFSAQNFLFFVRTDAGEEAFTNATVTKQTIILQPNPVFEYTREAGVSCYAVDELGWYYFLFYYGN